MSPTRKIWVLGAKIPSADRYVLWTKFDLPNLSEPDIIIINLLSLNEHILEKIHRNTISQAVSDKLQNGGTIIFITQHSILEKNESGATFYSAANNYFASPFGVAVNQVSEGQTIKYDPKSHPFSEYLDTVKKFKFTLKFSPSYSSYKELNEYIVTDNNNNHLGGGFKLIAGFPHNQGTVIYLPPPTEISIEEGISIILRKFGKSGKVAFPAWVSEIPLVPLTEAYRNLNLEKEKVKKGQIRIRKKQNEIQNLMNYYGLLTSRDDPLQDSVYQAFNTLGIPLKRKRANNLEDGVFNFQNISSYKYGVVEVKGSNKRTPMDDILECNKWVDQYYKRFGKAKGLFISNQYRLQKYPESLDKRIHFEPIEIEYAEERKICILPTCVLFEAVRNILNGSNKPNRSDLERTFSSTNGLLTALC